MIEVQDAITGQLRAVNDDLMQVLGLRAPVGCGG